MSEPTPLEADLRRRIAAAGPMPVAEYMALCLADRTHGYYTTREPIGAAGDFITAPEVSQMFGELIGLWMVSLWQQMGAPTSVRVIELGPGRGTLMKDALRAARLVPAFLDAAAVHLVEINPALESEQRRALQPLSIAASWHRRLGDIPRGPSIVVANEFFDALPVHQTVKIGYGWYERQVAVDAAGNLAFTIAMTPIPHFEQLLPRDLRGADDKSIFEWRDDTAMMDIARRIRDDGGAALIIDYGHGEAGIGDTLQAVSRHAYAEPLTAPGTVDLTAHVDFQALRTAGEAMGAVAHGPITQSLFLRRLGIETRAAMLKAKATRVEAVEIDAALERLIGIDRAAMGALFKALAFTAPGLGAPQGFA